MGSPITAILARQACNLADRYLENQKFRARFDSVAALCGVLGVDWLLGFSDGMRLAYVFPICLAARGAGRLWGLGIVGATASTLLAIDLSTGQVLGNWFHSFAIHAVLLTLLLHVIERLESGLNAYQLLATHDALTGLPNRVGLERFVAKAIAKAEEEEAPLTVAMIDCNGFKRLNDTYGHAYGDLVLKVLSRCLLKTFRHPAFVARVGGDEFVVVLPDTSPAQTTFLLDAVAARFERAGVTVGSQASLSYGIAQHGAGRPLDEMLAEADRKMYANKRLARSPGPVAV